MKPGVAALLAEGSRGLREGDWEAARAAFHAAREVEESAEALDGLGMALWWLNELEPALRLREQAYAAFEARGDLAAAAWIALWLAAQHLLIHGNEAAAGGWSARSQRLVARAGESKERIRTQVFSALASGDWARVCAVTSEAMLCARRLGDTEGEMLALAYGGLALVSMGQVSDGQAMLDEAMALAMSAKPESLEMIGAAYCAMLTACEQVVDVRRARQWCAVAEGYVERHRRSPMSASCRACYGSVLTVTGRWEEAEREFLSALATFEAGHAHMRVDALVRLAELRIRQGRFEEASVLLDGYDDHPDAARCSAALHLVRGRSAPAVMILERRLRQLGPESMQAVPILDMLVEAHLSTADPAAAESASACLQRLALRSKNDYVAGLARFARGRVLVARGDDPLADFDLALVDFERAQTPLEAAQVRLQVGRHLAEASPEFAAAEARHALGVFERLGARAAADAASQLLRQLAGGARTGPKRYGPISRREGEVLALLALGLSNEQLAKRLFISRRTAEHHVSSILAKLGVASRAEAVAFAVRNHPAGGGKPVRE